MKDGNKHGTGTLTYPDGSEYIGEFKDDYKDGYGTYTFQMEMFIKVVSKKIYQMVKVNWSMLMDPYIQETIWMEKEMVTVNT